MKPIRIQQVETATAIVRINVSQRPWTDAYVAEISGGSLGPLRRTWRGDSVDELLHDCLEAIEATSGDILKSYPLIDRIER